jgi:hypothetical protein
MPLAHAAPGSSNGERHRPNLNARGESALGDHSDRCAHHDRRRGSSATFLYSVPLRRACRKKPERKNPTTCCACHHRCEMRSEHQNWFLRRRARRGVESPTRCATRCDRRSDTEIKSNSALRPSWPAADRRLAPPTRATPSTTHFRLLKAHNTSDPVSLPASAHRA